VVVVQRVTVIEFGVCYGGCNDTGCFRIKIRTDAAKLTNVRIARFTQCRDLVRECEMFVKNEAKVTSRVSGVKRRVMHFSKLLFKCYEKKTCRRPQATQRRKRNDRSGFCDCVACDALGGNAALVAGKVPSSIDFSL